MSRQSHKLEITRVGAVSRSQLTGVKMKLPVPEEVVKALDSTAQSMVKFGQKLDRVIVLLEKIENNQRIFK